jgi:probable F420-dependent oxidoreductase
MTVSVRIFGFPLQDYRAVAQAVDTDGYHGLWVPDHVLSMMELESTYPYRDTGKPSFQGDTEFSDPLVMLAYLAGVTTTVRLGVGVYILPLRHPLHAARQLMSAQQVAAGRIDLGVGVGWAREEFDALGEEFDHRGARSVEMIEVMRQAWTGEPVSFAGAFYNHKTLQMSPAISTDIPVFWGGSSAISVKRAVGMAAGLYGPPGDLEKTLKLHASVATALDEAGRDPSTFRFISRCPGPLSVETVEAMLSSGLDDVVVDVPRDLLNVNQRVEWVGQATDILTRAGMSLS